MRYGAVGAYTPPPAGTTVSVVDPDQQSAAQRVVEYLRDRWRAFVALDAQMQDLQHRWAVRGADALAAGDTATNAQAKEAIARIGELRQLHGRALDMFAQLAAQLPPLQGLGQVPLVPLAIVGTVLALGAMVTYIFARVADEAERAPGGPGILGTLQGLSSTVKWVIGGAVAIMLLKSVQEATRRTR